jgi:hypothetical protein
VILITEAGGRRHTEACRASAKLNSTGMSDFGVLNNRKRALIALIHSFVFLGIAIHGFLSPKSGVLHGTGALGDFLLIGVYIIVASILAWLVSLSRCLRERIYFALCAASATFGLLRTVLGDTSLPIAQYMRVIMLSSAVAMGIMILRRFSRTVAEEVLSEE